eukprot:CAMPEP_0194701324 /NCGR_PEP_ID=MMETSP0295-20121207/26139_1 /TAXON_ID=39354 /ORGANISM="Heterosigma akashiwo, Strain CCMP2393" /LENGTH=74 /DNA_ID=CAMNT_0039595535 /DNA_START=25 /DNA_END=249 /DNA_ORIENTATION=+
MAKMEEDNKTGGSTSLEKFNSKEVTGNVVSKQHGERGGGGGMFPASEISPVHRIINDDNGRNIIEGKEEESPRF